MIVAAVAGTWRLVDPMSIDGDADRVSAIQTVFTIGFGFGGLATLALFARRQWLQEREHEHDRQVAADARHDAEQRRITEQYIQAVAQLGHDKAPVRLGGLYGLDRLGRDHPGQREKIAEVWCAYLRRRYSPPTDILTWPNPGAANESDLPEPEIQAEAEAADELEVRLTAQRLLAEHLKDPRPEKARDATSPAESPDYWNLKEVNLACATLIDLDFSHCRLPTLKASNACFHRRTSFSNVHFDGIVDLIRARFHGPTRFDGTHFHSDALCSETRFDSLAGFSEARFDEFAWFSETRFNGETLFDQARFNNRTMFNGAEFGNFASFAKAYFDIDAMFAKAKFGVFTNFASTHFGGDAWLDQTRFHGDALFTGAHFDHSARFVQARFDKHATFSEVHFNDFVNFSASHFGNGAKFEKTHFHGPAYFRGLQFGDEAISPQIQFAGATVHCLDFKESEHMWPAGWVTVPDGATWRLAWTRLRRAHADTSKLVAILAGSPIFAGLFLRSSELRLRSAPDVEMGR